MIPPEWFTAQAEYDLRREALGEARVEAGIPDASDDAYWDFSPYEPTDPKHPDYFDLLIEAVDNRDLKIEAADNYPARERTTLARKIEHV